MTASVLLEDPSALTNVGLEAVFLPAALMKHAKPKSTKKAGGWNTSWELKLRTDN